MKILVTGGAGFIGSNVVDRYIADGYDVVVVDNLSTGKKANLNPEAKFYQIGIEERDLEGVFEKEKPDIVNHHAAQIDVRKSVADPVYDANVNIIGSLNLYQQCIKFKVKKIIFASSGGAGYGEQIRFPADEKHPLQPMSPYGITKVTGELYLYFYAIIYGIDYTILRYANVYGPRQDPLGEAGVVAIFANAMFADKIPIINGDGKQTRDYIYVTDVVEANVLSLSKGSREAFNIGTGIETNVNKLAERLRNLIGYKGKIKHGLPKQGEQKRSVVDPTKANQILGWIPSVSLNNGLKKVVEWHKDDYAKRNRLKGK